MYMFKDEAGGRNLLPNFFSTWLKIDNDKIKKGLDIIFSENENELDNDDFKELPQSDETLAIPEHTSFWKSIWEGSKAVWEGK